MQSGTTPAAATPDAPPAIAAPVPATERIDSIDVLRGVAVLGILVMNIQWFAMVGSAAFNPTAYGDLTGANFAVWLVSHVTSELKFLSIFSMLFGAGIVLMSERAEARGRSAAALHYRRMGWLILFGALHAHLLWVGDILFSYGVCGLAAFLFRKLRPPTLIVLGLLAVAAASALSALVPLTMPYWPEEQVVEFATDWNPPPEEIERLLETYRGGWLGQLAHRVPEALEMQTFGLFFYVFWRAGGMMLVGMGLYKLGVFSARRSRGFYRALVASAVLVGLPAVLYGVRRNFEEDWEAAYSPFRGSQYNYWGSLLVALGWVALVMLVCKSPQARRRTGPLAAVGRMAFSCYLFQTLVCTTLFYGHGLGLIGRVERTGQAAFVVAIWIAQLILAPLWLRRYRFGPLEWLWRSLTYGRRQPMRREA